MQFIDLKAQYQLIKEDVLNEINQVLDSGQYILGAKVNELENKLSDYVGVKHTIGVADGTKALLIALMALNVSKDDEIIVPAFTFFATASMVALLGAKLVFVDIDPISYNIDPRLIESAITKKTKAIIAVSLFGQCADLEAINLIANKYKIAVIEDSAQSFGATHNNRHSGGITTIGTTSFFPSKPLGCYGDGGACFTNDSDLALKMQQIRIHGQDKRYHHAVLGVNGRIDTLQAAILLAKLRIFDKEVVLRSKIGRRYPQLLQASNCVVPVIMPNNTHIYAQYSILVENRDQFIENLNKEGIPTAVHYPLPLHYQPALKPYYDSAEINNLPNSEEIAGKIVSLPMHPYLDEDTQNHIIEIVKKYL